MQNDKTTTPVATAYDSNPFTMALGGLRKLVHTNGQAVVGVALFNILLFMLTGITAVILVLAIMAFVVKRSIEYQAQISDPNIINFVNSLSDSSLVATWIIGLAICVFLSALTQSLQLNLTVAAAKSVPLKFGALLKASVGSTMPILGLIGLALLAILVVIIAIGLASTVIGPIAFVLVIVAILAIIYVGLRVTYAAYAVVDLKLGPVAAIKRSWMLSRGHLIETVGATAVGWLVLCIPSLILQALVQVSEGAPMVSGIFSILDAVLMTILTIVATMVLAERYTQLHALDGDETRTPKLSPFNYLAIIASICVMSLLGALSPNNQDEGTNALPNPFESAMPADESSDGPTYRLN